MNFQSVLSDALAKILAAGLQQGIGVPQTHTLPSPAPVPVNQKVTPTITSHAEGASSEESEGGETYPEEVEFSEDEGLPPDKPVFTGLFCPSVFKSLLHKAKVSTKFGIAEVSPDSAAQSSAPHDAVFQVSKLDHDVIPCPPLFIDVIKTAFGQPGSLTAPSGLDKRLYASTSELEDVLSLPSVDPPVASLSSSSLMTSDIVDGLKAEDRKMELGFRKAHQVAAWAIKAATATSFFNRASLIWLRQLQERLLPDDTRLHQDINKLVAATEYLADASLTATKFASRLWLHL